MREQAIGGVRYVAVSATIPNVQDLAQWLGAPPAGIKCFGKHWGGRGGAGRRVGALDGFECSWLLAPTFHLR